MDRYPDIDQLTAAIKAEAARRGPSLLDEGAPPSRVGETRLQSSPIAARREPFFRVGSAKHVKDFLALHGPDFIRVVYTTLLRREPDAHGMDYYICALACGSRSRWEILVTIHYSPEGKMARGGARPLQGIRVLTLFTIAYRIPIVAPVVDLLAMLLRLPGYLRNTYYDDIRTIATLNGLR